MRLPAVVRCALRTLTGRLKGKPCAECSQLIVLGAKVEVDDSEDPPPGVRPFLLMMLRCVCRWRCTRLLSTDFRSHSNSTAEAVGANRPRTRRSRDAVRRASRRCRDASCVIRSLRLSSPHPLLPPCLEMGQPAQARHHRRRRRQRKVRRRRHHRWRSRRLPLLAVEAAAARSNAGFATGLCRRASYVPSWTSGESLARDVRRLSRSSR